MKLTILGTPRTKKNSPRIVPVGKGHRLLPSEAYEQYETTALWQIRSWKKLHRYIRLEFSAADSSVTAVAVDGCRLSVEHSVCWCDEDFTAYINANTHLPRGMDAVIEKTDKDVIIRCGDFIFGCPQKEGEFLDWRKVIPTGEPTFRIGFNGNCLLSALQAVKASCGGLKEVVVLEFRGPCDPVLLRTNKEDIKMVLPMRIKG